MKLSKKILNAGLLLLFAMLVLFTSCMKDKLDFDKMSTNIEYSPGIDAPLFKGSFSIEDLVSDDDEDSIIVFRGDQVILVLEMDSIYSFDVSSLVEIPEQDPVDYIIPRDEIPVDITIDSDTTFVQREEYGIALKNNMRLDSAFLNSGNLIMDITTTFNINGDLRIDIPGIYIDNEQFSKVIPITENPAGRFDTLVSYPLVNAVIIPDSTMANQGYINIDFQVELDVEPGSVIRAGSSTNIAFSIDGLEDFDAIFGYAGDTSFVQDTIMGIDLGTLEGVSGTFAITNPMIKINYAHSFGLPVSVDIDIKGYFEDSDSVILSPDTEILDASSDYLMPDVEGSIIIDKTTVPNIDDFLVFPPPDSIGYSLSVNANPDGDTTVTNFVLYDSELLIGMEVEVPLEFRADLQFRDTVKFVLFSDREEESEDVDYIEYARLFYIFRNEFPINLDADLVLYDSITDTNLDTLQLNETADDYFLMAAPVDSEGESIIAEVRDIEGSINIEHDMAYTLLNDANKLILIGRFSSFDPENVASVRILKSYSIDFKFGLDAKIHYVSSPDE